MARKVDLRWLLKGLTELEAREKGPAEPYPSQSTKLAENEAKHPGLVPFETKGRYKLLNKYSQMKINYRNAKEIAKAHYNNLPFGPNTKRAFNTAMDAGPEKAFSEKLVVSHEKKWANNWMKGVSR